MSIRENIAAIRARMADAALAAGRDPREILLCGASKFNDAAACREAAAAGIDCLGENRVQEMTAKWEENAYEGVPLHFIGVLQKNKVRQVVGKVSLIQSVDSMGLAGEIEKRAALLGIRQDILLEVNVGREASKSGFLPEDVASAAQELSKNGHLCLRGLMAIPPVAAERGGNRAYFAKMNHIFVDIMEFFIHNKKKPCLSMGMSDDFEDAIAEGSTMIRVGTAIFGPRSYGIEN